MKKVILILILFISFFCLQQQSYSASNYGFVKMHTPAMQSHTNNINRTNYVPPTVHQTVPSNSSISNIKVINYPSNSSSSTGSKVQVQNVTVGNEFYDFVFLLDYSSSMKKKIGQVKSIMLELLPTIPPYTHAGMRVFGQKVVNEPIKSNNFFKNVANDLGGVVGKFSNACQATEQVVPVCKVNSSSFVSAMNDTQIGSSTPLTYALEQTVANDFKGKNYFNKKKIILITDGEESCGGDPCNFVKKLITSRNDISIDVIMLNDSNNLRCLADISGGTFYKAYSQSELERAMGDAVRDASKGSVVDFNREERKLLYEQHYQFLNE